MLTRLSEKKALKETKKGNTGIYEPILTHQNARRTALKSLANQAFDGAFGPLMHFLIENQKLSAKQKQLLLESLKLEKNKGKGDKK